MIISALLSFVLINYNVQLPGPRMRNHVLMQAGTVLRLGITNTSVARFLATIGPLNIYQSTPLATITGAWNATNLTGVAVAVSSTNFAPPTPPINATGGVINFTMRVNDTSNLILAFYSLTGEVVTMTQPLLSTYRYS